MNKLQQKPEATCDSSEVGYRVQTKVDRICLHNPCTLPDGIVTEDWRDVHFPKGQNPAGVPVPYGFKGYHDLLTYEGATALAWTIIAQNPYKFGLQCRVVPITVETSYKLTRGEPLPEIIKTP